MLHYFTWLLVTILYTPIFLQLYRSRWESIDYTHAYFILPVALLIVWEKKSAIQKALTRQQSSPRALPLLSLGLGIFLFIFGWRLDYLFITTFSLIPVLVGLVSYLYGTRVLRILAFPIAYLLLLVPPPLGILDAVTLPMRHGVSVAAEFLLKSFFLPVHREGLLLYMGNSELYMGAACSGFRSLVTLFALALAYVYFLKAQTAKKVILLLWVLPLALLGNLLRVLSLCLVTYYLGEEAGQGAFHDISGIVVFIFLIGGLMLIEKSMSDEEE